MILYILPFFKAAVILFLLRSGDMISGAMPVWQQITIYTFLSAIGNVLTYLTIIGNNDAATGAFAIIRHIFLIAVAATAYFIVSRKLGGKLETAFNIIGGAILVYYF